MSDTRHEPPQQATPVETWTSNIEDRLHVGDWATRDGAVAMNVALLTEMVGVVACQIERIANAAEGRGA